MIPAPTTQEFIDAFSSAIRGAKDKHADIRRGSRYETLAGVSAILWSRQAQRDTDLFRATRDESADDRDLTERMWRKYAIERREDTYGRGTAVFTRYAAYYGAGTIWAGTRIYLLPRDGQTEGKYYVVTRNTEVSSDKLVATDVPIRAEGVGLGWAISESALGAFRLDDVLWDTAWTVTSLECSNGTVFESASEFKARVRQTLLDTRVGHRTAIVAACNVAGAASVVLFSSDFGGSSEDHGLNMCYVGDAGFTTTDGMIPACILALESVRVMGDNIQVLPMQQSTLTIRATVYLREDPSRYDRDYLYRQLSARIVQSMGGIEGGFTYSLEGLAGDMVVSSNDVQEVEFHEPSADGTVLSLSGGLLNFPTTLTRYRTTLSDIHLTFAGPR